MAARNPAWRKTAATSACASGYRVSTRISSAAQPLEIGRQKNVGDAGAGMRHKLPGELRGEREVFVQAPGKCRGGFVVAGVNGGEEQPEQRAADRLQRLRHTGAFLEQDAPCITLALQQLRRERGAHLSRQVGLCVPPNRIARDVPKRSATARFESPVAIARSICGRAG